MCNISLFLANEFSKLFFFSVIIIVFLELILFCNKLLFINVSMVFPDLEIIIKRLFFKFIFFLYFQFLVDLNYQEK